MFRQPVACFLVAASLVCSVGNAIADDPVLGHLYVSGNQRLSLSTHTYGYLYVLEDRGFRKPTTIIQKVRFLSGGPLAVVRRKDKDNAKKQDFLFVQQEDRLVIYPIKDNGTLDTDPSNVRTVVPSLNENTTISFDSICSDTDKSLVFLAGVATPSSPPKRGMFAFEIGSIPAGTTKIYSTTSSVFDKNGGYAPIPVRYGLHAAIALKQDDTKPYEAWFGWKDDDVAPGDGDTISKSCSVLTDCDKVLVKDMYPQGMCKLGDFIVVGSHSQNPFLFFRKDKPLGKPLVAYEQVFKTQVMQMAALPEREMVVGGLAPENYITHYNLSRGKITSLEPLQMEWELLQPTDGGTTITIGSAIGVAFRPK